MADQLKAEWFALYVQTPAEADLSQEERDRVANSLRLAEELGARTVSHPGQSVVETVLEYAQRHNITKIIAGKPIRSRWIDLFRGSVVDRLIRASGNIDVYVINNEAEPRVRRLVESWRPHHPWGRYLMGLLLVAAATGLSALIHPYITPTNLVVIYLLSVVLAAVYLGRGPAIMTSILGVAAFDYFFVPPHLTFIVSNTEYLLTFFGLLAVGLVISQLTATVRGQTEAVQRRELETVELYQLGRDLTVAADLDAVARAAIEHVGQTFSREVAIFLPDKNHAKLYVASPGLVIPEEDRAVADWSFEHGQVAGRGTGNSSPGLHAFSTSQDHPRRRGHIGSQASRPIQAFNPGSVADSGRLCQPDRPGHRARQPGRTGPPGRNPGSDRQASECPPQFHFA